LARTFVSRWLGAQLRLFLPGAHGLANDLAVRGVAAFLELGADQAPHHGWQGDAETFNALHMRLQASIIA
jgi:hypothetical protein